MRARELSPSVAAGLRLFARYAYPPNERGSCGPEDHVQLLEYTTSGLADGGLAQLARTFTGPWPYLTLLAGAAGVDDPFEYDVVEAYWVGNPLLERVRTADFGLTLEDRFKRQAGPSWGFLAEGVPEGAACHHSFHVLGVYPWLGHLRRSGRQEPLEVLDRCRIRWGQVRSASPGSAEVASAPLTWDGQRLGIGEPRSETVRCAVSDLVAGEWVALHWDWVCDRLTPRQLGHLRSYTGRQLAISNDGVAHSGPGMAMS